MEDELQKVEEVRVGAFMEKLKRVIRSSVTLHAGEFYPTMKVSEFRLNLCQKLTEITGK